MKQALRAVGIALALIAMAGFGICGAMWMAFGANFGGDSRGFFLIGLGLVFILIALKIGHSLYRSWKRPVPADEQ